MVGNFVVDQLSSVNVCVLCVCLCHNTIPFRGRRLHTKTRSYESFWLLFVSHDTAQSHLIHTHTHYSHEANICCVTMKIAVHFTSQIETDTKAIAHPLSVKECEAHMNYVCSARIEHTIFSLNHMRKAS